MFQRVQEALRDGAVDEVGYTQRVPCRVAAMLLSNESALQPPTESLREVLLELQKSDPFVTEARYELEQSRKRAGSHVKWARDAAGLLRREGAVYVPCESSIRAEVLRMHHDDPLAGHFGVRRTLELLQRKFFWTSMRRDVKSYIATCTECQRGKARRHRPYGEMASFPPPSRPWQEITMDFITDLPPSKSLRYGKAFDSILVIVDRFTKMARYIPVNKTIDAPELAELFVHYVVRDFGCPEGITSDRGPQFKSKFWGSLMWYLGVRRRLSTAYRPQTDGQTERQNQVLEFYLRTYCNYRQDDWVSKLALAELTYNNSVHASTGESPFMLMYGQHPSLGSDVVEDVPGGGVAIAPMAQERMKTLIEDRAKLTETLRIAGATHKKFYDKKHKATRFQVGQKVLLKAENIRQLRPNRKLSDKYLGPFEVKDVIGSHGQAYRLKLPDSYQIHSVFHVSLLEPWNGREGVEIDPAPIQVEGEDRYLVESIVAHKETRQGRRYLVKWKGYGPAHNTWEPIAHLEGVGDFLEGYLQSQPAPLPEKKKRSKKDATRRKTRKRIARLELAEMHTDH